MIVWEQLTKGKDPKNALSFSPYTNTVAGYSNIAIHFLMGLGLRRAHFMTAFYTSILWLSL